MALINTSYVETNEFFWTQRIVTLISELIMICIFAMYIRDCIKFMLNKQSKETSPRTVTSTTKSLCHLFTQLTLLIYCIQGANFVLDVWSVFDAESISCNIIKKISVITYHLAKLSLYIVLTLRVKLAFHDSMFDNDKKVKFALYLIYFLTFSFFWITIFGDLTEITGTLTYVNNNKDMYYCLLDEMPTWGLATFSLLDMIISILCVTVFNYPLRVLLKAHAKPSIIELIRKYAILSTTAICSTFLFILTVAIFKLGMLSLVDNIINTLCLLCMSSWYRNYYHMLCCCWYSREQNIFVSRVTSNSEMVTSQTSSQKAIEFEPPVNTSITDEQVCVENEPIAALNTENNVDA
eukprot:211623_1